MKYRTKYRLGILFFFFITLVASGCNSSDSIETGESREGHPDQESWDVKITLTEEGSIRAIVKADHLEKYNERQYILLDQNVAVDFYDENENHMSRLTADMAEIEEQSNFMRAIDHVVVISDSGVTMYTDTLSWDNDLEIIFTDDSVMLTTEQNDTLYGIGFESDVRLEQWKIMHPSGVTDRAREE